MSDSSPNYVERTVSRSSSGLGTVLCRQLNEDLDVDKGLRLSRAARGGDALHARELLAAWGFSAFARVARGVAAFRLWATIMGQCLRT